MAGYAVTRSYMRKNGGKDPGQVLLERVGDKAVEMFNPPAFI